ncbi:MAG: ATP-binding protein [Methanococcaceae archaeon]
MNKLRTKIFLALAFLFLIIVVLGFFGSSFIRRLATDSGHIIQDNYASAQYSTNMLKAVNRIYNLHAERDLLKHDVLLNRTDDFKALFSEFEKNLNAEEANVTEAGEIELVNELSKNYSDFVLILHKMNSLKPSELQLADIQLLDKYENLQGILNDIYKLNTIAILKKNDQALQTAGKVSMYMLMISIVSSVVALLFILYLPKYLVRPIDELTAKIRKISEGNYNQQLNIHSNDELGELSKAFNDMSVKLKEYEENNVNKLLIEKKRLESVIDSLSDAIIVLDENKRIISANYAAYEITGLKESESIGKYAPDIAAGNDLMRELIKDLMVKDSDALESQNVQKNFIPIRVIINNKEQYFNKETLKININEGESGRLIGYIMLLKNITQFEERDSAKTNLIATVSHELKTPISSINLSLKLLENEKVGSTNEEQRQIMNSMKQQTIRLSKMVNELLDYSQAESGNIKLKMERVAASDIIDYAAVSMVMIIAEKKIQLDTCINDDLPSMNADIEKTVWVLVNLINNAVRYTPENGEIKITAERQKDYVVISVIDQGSGISPEDQEKIFNKFVQVGNQNPRGRGLGLAISKEFVISQGGDIWVESQIGAGSKFSFKLPAAE